MLNTGQNIVVILSTVTLALSLLILLRKLSHPAVRHEHNNLVGWQISILGTTYAVILAFMLWNVWSNFQSAEVNAELEANSLVNIYRLSQGLPSAQTAEIQRLARKYADVMLAEEWPAMSKGNVSAASFEVTQQLWAAMAAAQASQASQTLSISQTLAELANMSQHRRIRQLQSRSSLPTILWIILIVGGVITIGSSCLFATENFKLHFILVLALTLMVSLVLVAIADIDRPFQGSVRVSADAFRLAQQTFQRLSSANSPP
ncbi:MAG TPA: hypothetical protein VMT20_10140 [Terriglobia bacterium]|nr:hypothetical protein [Terriglobia bacterium]